MQECEFLKFTQRLRHPFNFYATCYVNCTTKVVELIVKANLRKITTKPQRASKLNKGLVLRFKINASSCFGPLSFLEVDLRLFLNRNCSIRLTNSKRVLKERKWFILHYKTKASSYLGPLSYFAVNWWFLKYSKA